MKFNLDIRLVVFSLVFACRAILFAGDVYVVSDGYKFLPDGNVLELSKKPVGQLKEENSIWNSKANQIRIAGARGETVAFQIILEGEAKDVLLSSNGIKGPVEFPPDAVSFHVVSWVSYQEALYPDVVVPLGKAGASTFSIPYAIPGLLAVPTQKVGVVMVEIKIPETAMPGDYSAEIQVSGGKTATLKLDLTVWNFSLPSKPSIVFDFNSYGSPLRKLGFGEGGVYKPLGEEGIKLEREFYRCANEHRAYLNILPYHSQRGKPSIAPILSGAGKDVKCDWTDWDKRFGPIFDGSAFADNEPVPYFYLPFNLHWPYGYSHDEKMKDQRLDWCKKPEYAIDHTKLITQEYLDEWAAVAKQMVDHFAEKGWTKTTFQVYLNHCNGADNRHSNSPWRCDEPYDRLDFQVLAYYADLTHRVFKNDKNVSVKFRLDLGHFYCHSPSLQCENPKKYDLPLEKNGGGKELLEPRVDLWYTGTRHSWANREAILDVAGMKPGREMFVYGGGQRIMDGAPVHRSLYWFLYDYRERGYCGWTQNCVDPDVKLETIGGKKGSVGDDHLWYVGKNGGEKGALPSLRMKLWRRGSFDAEYLFLAEQRTSRDQVMKIVNNICGYHKGRDKKGRPATLLNSNNNPEDFELARAKLASLILAKDLTAGRIFAGKLEGGLAQEDVDQIQGY
jgi:hypothetical protein